MANIRISSKPPILRKLGMELRTLKGKHRVAQQRRFLATQKKLQLKEFRTGQKLQLAQRRQQISTAKQQIQRIKQIRFAKKTAGIRRLIKGARKLSKRRKKGGFGITWN